jgi:hypothetical protein
VYRVCMFCVSTVQSTCKDLLKRDLDRGVRGVRGDASNLTRAVR